MTVRFNCPDCNELIAFGDKDIGKRARCLQCGRLFIIPAQDGQTPEKVQSPEEIELLKPIPGFFRAAFVDCWKLFANPENIKGFVFVAAAVTFKFFIGDVDYSFDMPGGRFQAPLGQIVTVCAWGCLFWYYMNIISSVAFDEDELPETDIGGIFGFIAKVVKSVFAFSLVLIVAELPCIIYILLSRAAGFYWEPIANVLVVFGLFFFPAAIMTYTVTDEFWMSFRADYLYKPIVRAFFPYLVIFILFVTCWELQLNLKAYMATAPHGHFVVAVYLLAQLAVQLIAIITMRSIGLFYSHYRCYLPW